MPKKKVEIREVGDFLESLEAAGARDVRRAPADRRGLVEIRWRFSQVEEERRAAVERAERTAIVLSAMFAVVVIAVILISVL